MKTQTSFGKTHNHRYNKIWFSAIAGAAMFTSLAFGASGASAQCARPASVMATSNQYKSVSDELADPDQLVAASDELNAAIVAALQQAVNDDILPTPVHYHGSKMTRDGRLYATAITLPEALSQAELNALGQRLLRLIDNATGLKGLIAIANPDEETIGGAVDD